MTDPNEVPPADPPAAVLPSIEDLVARVDALTARVAALEARPAPVGPVAAVPVAAVTGASASAPPAPKAADRDEIRRLLSSLFSLAATTVVDDPISFDAGFEAFLALVHSDRRGSPLLDGDLRRYKFFPFVGRARDYLADASNPGSFQIERMVPDAIDARTEVVKLHLVARGGRRMAPPITFRRDRKADGAFRIENSSL